MGSPEPWSAQPDGPMAPADAIAHFIGCVPDGAVIDTDPETAGPVEQAIRDAGRSITVEAYPAHPDDLGILRATWTGPAEGEHSMIEAWL